MFYENVKKSYKNEPTLYYCGRDDELKPGAKYGPVIRDVYVVECCTGGYGKVIINGKEFGVSAGCCYILLPGDVVTHIADTVEPRRGVWCAIDGDMIGDMLKAAGITAEKPFVCPDAFNDITLQLEAMYAMRNDTDCGADLRRTASVYNVLGAVMRNVNAANSNIWVRNAIGIMEARYFEELSVEAIAKETGLERTYFSTLFRNKTGQTPYGYLTDLRIKKAATLLKSNNSTIAEVAASVGLDPQNFSRIFKKQIGVTPMEYRKKNS